LEIAINSCDTNLFNDIINRSWENKKNTSKQICENKSLIELDNTLTNDSRVLSHKLCGAGNGGYFLIFTNKNSNVESEYTHIKKVGISSSGLKYINLKNEFTEV
jgi:galactokinase/mevalonate kinase-like predicted kinase